MISKTCCREKTLNWIARIPTVESSMKKAWSMLNPYHPYSASEDFKKFAPALLMTFSSRSWTSTRQGYCNEERFRPIYMKLRPLLSNLILRCQSLNQLFNRRNQKYPCQVPSRAGVPEAKDKVKAAYQLAQVLSNKPYWSKNSLLQRPRQMYRCKP